MNSLKFLELQRLIKELQFVESDYVYQSEIIRESDIKFLDDVNEFLELYPDLKNVWKEKLEKKYEFKDQVSDDIIKEEIVVSDKPNIKKLYREIVKNTHPDKVKNESLNNLYLDATTAYNSNDFVTIFKVCAELQIKFDWEDSDIVEIQNRINLFRTRIKFLESTYTYKWLKSDFEQKKKVVLNFIENKIK
jgi:hypothetical protein